MSPSGVLIEGPGLPGAHAPVSLKRGDLQASGQVAWKADQKAGIAFSTTVHVPSWISRQSPSQARIDAIVSDFKSGRPAEDHGQAVAQANSSLEAQLRELRAGLAQLGDSLVNDPELVATHPEIQMLDMSVQRIDRMIAQLRDG